MINKKPYWVYLFQNTLSFYIFSCFFTIASFGFSEGIITSSFYSSMFSLVVCLFFLPVLAVISMVNWLMNSNIKYIISFVLAEFYGYMWIIEDRMSLENMDVKVGYFSLSIPATLVFLFICFFLEKRNQQ